jgi:hypothetical protein
MKHLVCTLLLACFLSSNVFAQRYREHRDDRYDSRRYEEAKNAVYVEVGGNGVGYTINYDRKLGDKFSLRGGIEFWGVVSSEGGAGIVLAPVMVNYLAGRGDNRLELGLGKLFAQVGAGYSDSQYWSRINGDTWTGTIGFRHQPRRGGFLFRVGLTPIIVKDFTFLWAGGSVGIAF